MQRDRAVVIRERQSLERTLEIAREERDRGRERRGKGEELSRQLGDHRARIATRQLACDLLDGAAQRMADGFNEHLRSLVSRNLPRFTDGRYEYLQVGEDLQLRVYSNEKRGFLDLEEISSGTQRQITLALRLALAQEHVSRAAEEHQFAFLDEPFAFFDDTRMRGALRTLPDLSDVITQHWVVAQRFPRDEFIALEIPCSGHADTLEVGHREVDRAGAKT
jgi:exonuclease SbcC